MNPAPGKILVVDDTAEVLSLLTEILTGAGYCVETAVDGREGYAKFEHTAYAAIMIDLWMPVMDGMSVIVAIRKKNKSIPIILITGLEKREKFIEAASEAGADCVIKKPFKNDNVLETLAVLLHRDSASMYCKN